jgi:hypothetical protein
MFKKYFSLKYWKGQRLLLLAFLVLHTVVSFYYISQQSITYDEPDYIEYAKHYLHGHPERVQPLDDSKSPMVAVCWLPRIVRQIINPSYRLTDDGKKDQQEGRHMMILYSFLTAIYVFKWCRGLYGDKGWQMPLLLLLFDPLYLAYSTLMTTDLACGAFLIAVVYHFRKFLLFRSKKHFVAAAVLTGLGIVTKQTLFFLVIILPILSLLHTVLSNRFRLFFSFKSLGYVFVFGLVVLLVINGVYYFHHTLRPFGSYVFESKILNDLQHLRWFNSIPVPLPEGYVQSLDMLKAHADIGAGKPESTFNGVYLFGDLKLKGGYWYYYLVLLWYKLPIGTLLLFTSCIILFVKNATVSGFRDKYMFLIVPTLFYLLLLSLFNQFQNGIRHLLLIFPLLFTGLGYLFYQLRNAQWKYRGLSYAAIAYTFVTIIIYYPHLIPYTNEFISNKKTVYKKIHDSSIDYGQSEGYIHAFLSDHPEYNKASADPEPGKYAVVLGDVFNTYLKNRNVYKWYLAFEPKAHYRYTILLFDITKEDIEQADFSKTNYRIVN